MRKGLEQQKLAVQSGHWTLMRYNPLHTLEGKNPLTIDSKAPSIPLEKYIYNETRYRALRQSDAQRGEELLHQAQTGVNTHWQKYQQLLGMLAEDTKPE
jgi:pyruvate-ferredoxin/flavodoxin oxidoreductase